MFFDTLINEIKDAIFSSSMGLRGGIMDKILKLLAHMLRNVSIKYDPIAYFSFWISPFCNPMAYHVVRMRDEYEFERDRQIVTGEYTSEIEGSLGGYAVIGGVCYELNGYQPCQ